MNMGEITLNLNRYINYRLKAEYKYKANLNVNLFKKCPLLLLDMKQRE